MRKIIECKSNGVFCYQKYGYIIMKKMLLRIVMIISVALVMSCGFGSAETKYEFQGI